MTDYQRIAKRVGFTISQLAAIMGYNRHGLYKILSGEIFPNLGRWSVAVRTVGREIETEYQIELAALNNRYAERRKAAEELLYLAKEDAE